MALNKDDEVIGYEFINLGKMMDVHQEAAIDANEAMEKATAATTASSIAPPSISTRDRNKRGGRQ